MFVFTQMLYNYETFLIFLVLNILNAVLNMTSSVFPIGYFDPARLENTYWEFLLWSHHIDQIIF